MFLTHLLVNYEKMIDKLACFWKGSTLVFIRMKRCCGLRTLGGRFLVVVVIYNWYMRLVTGMIADMPSHIRTLFLFLDPVRILSCFASSSHHSDSLSIHSCLRSYRREYNKGTSLIRLNITRFFFTFLISITLIGVTHIFVPEIG